MVKKLDPKCNLCGGKEFAVVGKRKNARCVKCNSLERTRLIKLFLDDLGLPKPNSSILHFAPEEGLSKILSKSKEYKAVDLFPNLFNFTSVEKFDITKDIHSLPSKKYDLIIHSHVMEHIPCDITSVLYHIHRALKPSGYHICCIPILTDTTYAEDLGDISDEYATQEFGQYDHVRRWGSKDLNRTLGMAIKLPRIYNVEDNFDAKTLESVGVPKSLWRGYNPSSVLVLKRDDMKLLHDPFSLRQRAKSKLRSKINK